MRYVFLCASHHENQISAISAIWLPLKRRPLVLRDPKNKSDMWEIRNLCERSSCPWWCSSFHTAKVLHREVGKGVIGRCPEERGNKGNYRELLCSNPLVMCLKMRIFVTWKIHSGYAHTDAWSWLSSTVPKSSPRRHGRN